MRLIFFLCLLIPALLGCGTAGDKDVIRLGHGLDVNHPVHKAMEFMAERVREKSSGDLTIQVYPSQQLGTERELLELVQIGSVDMTKVSGAVLENFVPEIRVLSLPYLFRDDRHLWNVLRGKIGKELLLQGEEALLRGLTYYDAGKRSFYTIDRPIREPSDLEGLKIRVQESVIAIKMVQQLGGSPTPISWGELYTALQQGVVDGAENNPPSFYTSRHYEVCNYYSLDEHTAVPDILLIGTRTWEKLSEQERQWVQEAADESAVYQRELWRKEEQRSMKAAREAGIEIIRPDKQPFMEKVEPMYEEYRRQEPEFFKLIERIRSVNDTTQP